MEALGTADPYFLDGLLGQLANVGMQAVMWTSKIGAKVVSHGRYLAFQMAEVAIPRNLFADILRFISQLRPPPDTAPV